MAKRLSRIERDIERLKEKISEYQQQLKELEAAKTEQENLQIIQLVRSMNMKPDEFAAFLRSGALNAAPTATPYHKQEDCQHRNSRTRWPCGCCVRLFSCISLYLFSRWDFPAVRRHLLQCRSQAAGSQTHSFL